MAMKISQPVITIGQLCKGYKDSGEDGEEYEHSAMCHAVVSATSLGR